MGILFFIFPPTTELWAILAGATVLMAIGVLDDIYNISPYIRLIAGFLVAFGIVFSGIGIQYVSNPLGSGVIWLNQLTIKNAQITIPLLFLAEAISATWIVWNMNIVNWSKGLDGQLPGVVSIAALFIGLLSLRFASDPNQIPVALLAFAVSGAYAGFLLWNMYPQKIMPGYGAGSLGGYFLAVLSILSGAKLATALLVLSVPTADAVFTIVRRLLKKKSPFWGDRGHLHHKLLDDLGWSKRQIAFFYWFTTAVFGLIALQLKPQQKVFTIVVSMSLVFGFLIWVKLFISSSKQRDQDNG